MPCVRFPPPPRPVFEVGGCREVLEWPYTAGGGGLPPPLPTPPPKTKGTIVGKNEIYNWENLVRQFLVHKFLGPRPPPLPPLIPPPTYPGVCPRPVLEDEGTAVGKVLISHQESSTKGIFR